jgi:hypothetical protein
MEKLGTLTGHSKSKHRSFKVDNTSKHRWKKGKRGNACHSTCVGALRLLALLTFSLTFAAL